MEGKGYIKDIFINLKTKNLFVNTQTDKILIYKILLLSEKGKKIVKYQLNFLMK